MAATFDRLSNGRLLINVVTGGDPVENSGDGVFLTTTSATQSPRIPDDLARAAGRHDGVNFDGKHLQIEDGQLLYPPVQRRIRRCCSAARRMPARRRGDTRHLSDLGRAAGGGRGEDARRRAAAGKRGRKLKFGIRLHVIVRETEEEAWAAAGRLISTSTTTPSPRRRRSSRRWIRSASAAWRSCTAAGRDKLEVFPNLWAGVGLVRGGAGTALVGNPERSPSASRSTRTSASTPSSCPAIRISRSPIASPSWCSRCCRSTARKCRRRLRATGPFGEIVANDIVPRRGLES